MNNVIASPTKSTAVLFNFIVFVGFLITSPCVILLTPTKVPPPNGNKNLNKVNKPMFCLLYSNNIL